MLLAERPRLGPRSPRGSGVFEGLGSSLGVCLGLSLALACARPPARAEPPAGPTQLPILDPDYGGAAELPAAIAIGDRLTGLSLALADGGPFEIDPALAAGPVILVWIGGAEHEIVSDWVRALDGELAQLDRRAATLVWVRPLAAEASLRWATELRLRTPVVADPHGELAALLGATPAAPLTLDVAVVIVIDGIVGYRKLGGRRPELAELLAVLDGEAERLRCCPEPCAGEPCQ
jgi:hypothetical protein